MLWWLARRTARALLRPSVSRRRRSRVPQALRHLVMARDGYRCVFCGSRHRLQIDHIRPRAAGGRTVPGNLATLCERCNLVKSDYWPGRRYHPWPGHRNRLMAMAILHKERQVMRRWRSASVA